MDNVGINANYHPALVKFSFRDSNDMDIENMVMIEKNIEFEFFANAWFTGINYQFLNYNELRDTRFINFCVYESNNSGKGFRILKLYSFNIGIEYMDQDIIELKIPLICVNHSTKPIRGEFEGIRFAENYDFRTTFIALKIFYSSEKISDAEELDGLFYELNNVALDAKIPFKVVD